MRFFLAFFSAKSVPIGFLNIFGGIVSGIWLAFLGLWRPIDIGLLSLFCTTWLIGFALMPALLFAAPAAMAFERGHRFADVVFGAFTKFYTTAVIVTRSYLVLLFFARMATPTSLLPILLWSYGVATGPWAFLAQKDRQGDGRNPYSLLNVYDWKKCFWSAFQQTPDHQPRLFGTCGCGKRFAMDRTSARQHESPQGRNS